MTDSTNNEINDCAHGFTLFRWPEWDLQNRKTDPKNRSRETGDRHKKSEERRKERKISSESLKSKQKQIDNKTWIYAENT